MICNEIKNTSQIECDIKDIGGYWWKVLSKGFRESHGPSFIPQRTLELHSLNEAIKQFQSAAKSDELIEKQYAYWQKPEIFKDTIPFLQSIDIPVYVLSNIDTDDVLQAIEFNGIEVSGLITSEEVKAYKPRPEMFEEALRRYKLDKSDVIHVGDSLSSDIIGAQSVGIKAVWLNRKHRSLPEGIKPDYIFRDLENLKTIM